MDIKEILKRRIQSFLVVFGSSVIAMYVYLLIFGIFEIDTHNITALLISSVLIDSTPLIFYSKKELSRSQMFVRYVVHLIVILVILLSMATFMTWIKWSEPMQILVFLGLIAVVYLAVMASGMYKSKKLADRLNQKLKERFK